MVWYGIALHCIAWYGMVLHGVVWCGVYGIALQENNKCVTIKNMFRAVGENVEPRLVNLATNRSPRPRHTLTSGRKRESPHLHVRLLPHRPLELTFHRRPSWSFLRVRELKETPWSLSFRTDRREIPQRGLETSISHRDDLSSRNYNFLFERSPPTRNCVSGRLQAWRLTPFSARRRSAVV